MIPPNNSSKKCRRPQPSALEYVTKDPSLCISWQELRAALEQADRIMTEAQNNTKVDPWMTEELGNFIERANEMYNEKTASEEEIRHMIEELSWITMEVEEAMKS